MKKYIIIGHHKETGQILGYIERSFSMGLSNDRVRIWYEFDGSNRHLKNVEMHKNTLVKKYTDYNWKVYRVGSKNCPVKIDWARYHELKHNSGETYNLKFKNKL